MAMLDLEALSQCVSSMSTQPWRRCCISGFSNSGCTGVDGTADEPRSASVTACCRPTVAGNIPIMAVLDLEALSQCVSSVSYTHLDVYKRQVSMCARPQLHFHTHTHTFSKTLWNSLFTSFHVNLPSLFCKLHHFSTYFIVCFILYKYNSTEHLLYKSLW